MHACTRRGKKRGIRVKEEGIERKWLEAEEWRSDEGRYEGIRRAKWCPKLGRVGARTARRSVKFPNFRPLRGIRAGKRVTGAKRVESRAKGTSFCLTADCPYPFSPTLSLSLPASPFNSPFNSSLVFFSYSFSLSLSLWLCVIFLGVCTSIIPSSSFSRLFLVSYGCRASASRFRRGVNGEQYLDLDLREISRNSLGIGVPRRRNLFGVQWSSFNWPKLNRIQTG